MAARGGPWHAVPMKTAPLAARHCVPCEGGTPPLTADQVGPLLAQVPGWEIEDAGEHEQLSRAFRFRDFVAAVDFVNRITPVAEAEGHHPDLLVTWGRVRVQLWTHVAGGLTENDFVLAARIDALAPAG
jgi:4a-hydroxytetrahydrobiopterin dehydratase